jgi:hypothetical protein
MNNGAEIFAKLPNPNAGPAHYTTASEVATRKLVYVTITSPPKSADITSFEKSSIFLYLACFHGLVMQRATLYRLSISLKRRLPAYAWVRYGVPYHGKRS